MAEVPVHAFGHEPVVLLDRDLDAELTVERDLRPAHRHLSQDEEREPEDPERGGRKDGDPAPVGVRGDDDEGEADDLEEHDGKALAADPLVLLARPPPGGRDEDRDVREPPPDERQADEDGDADRGRHHRVSGAVHRSLPVAGPDGPAGPSLLRYRRASFASSTSRAYSGPIAMRFMKALLLAAALLAALPARGAPDPLADPRRDIVGAELDLLPVAISAADGEVGGALQLWAGQGRARVRLVTAILHFPDSLTDAPFRDRDLTVLALIYDRFFRDGFRGPWIGGGLEVWWTDIGTELGPERAERTNPVATLGAGWVFPVWRGLYLNPWAAGHVQLGNPEIELRGERFRPPRVQAEASLKIGWAVAL